MRRSPDSLAATFAERIESDAAWKMRVDGSPPQDLLADATAPESARVSAVTVLLSDEGYYAEAIALGLDFAMYSTSPETRLQAWRALRQNTYDPMLAAPLSTALMTDPDASVRKEAALALAYYLAEGGRAVLEHVARNDVSSEVRLAARMGLFDHDERNDFERATLLDRSLAPAERLAPTVMAEDVGMTVGRNFDNAPEVALAYAEIARDADDGALKIEALSRLTLQTSLLPPVGSPSPDARLIDALLASAESADRRVHRAALLAMANYSDHPQVRDVLETVIESEPELAAELNIAQALARPSMLEVMRRTMDR